MKGARSLFLLAFLLSGCAETELIAHMAKKIPFDGDDVRPSPMVSSASSEGVYKVGKPYVINGRTYYPEENYGYDETGISSWYGPGFHARKTANGEKFDQRAMTAAHRTLPMPCFVRVTNLENGHAVILRVNDRGPYARGRIIDVSERAAELLGFRTKGTAKVRVQVLAEESRAIAAAKKAGRPEPQEILMASSVRLQDAHAAKTAPPRIAPTKDAASSIEKVDLPDVVEQVPVSATQIYVQAGAFTQENNAVGLARQLAGIAETSIQPANVQGRDFFRVRLGPVASVDKADEILKKVVETGINAARIIVD
ncbi:MAG TPA: septal ring lytic transglycosylase RlpA family protein [Rhodospirillaceae bacterium]|nr:MAG: hypothetical protein A2018_04295 [Alphaproteobacteria bacterium GWF2_58_20]HAU28740.1 septal ring lytic transglycosylase RlpA family protein [Rhodospirillaceae bacterium]